MILHGKKILLTGGSGFLGGHIRDQLVKEGLDEIRIPRSKDTDLRIWENCVKAVEGVDLVIHAAGNVGGIG